MTFRALVLTKDDGKVAAAVQDLTQDKLPQGDVLVRIAYSSLNYKDGLALAGNPGVVRNFPMVAGI